MTSPVTVIKKGVTDRGNKDKGLLSTYLFPNTHRKFKAKCALFDVEMTNIIEGFIEGFVGADNDEARRLIDTYVKKAPKSER